MSETSAEYSARRWMDTAREDLESARILAAAQRHSHACFLAQQSAEKAVKALWYRLDDDPWGHAVQKLLQDFPERETVTDFAVCLEHGSDLDRYYIPTRYPNGLPDLTPHEAYAGRDSTQAVEKAAFILERAGAWLAARSRSR